METKDCVAECGKTDSHDGTACETWQELERSLRRRKRLPANSE